MKIYHSLKDIKEIRRGTVVAVGIFDGIHRGHIHIIKKMQRAAKRLNRKSVILTFYPHPSLILHPDERVPLLESLKHRLKLLRRLRVDIVLLVYFNRNFSKVGPEDFIKRVLLKRLNMKEMFVGENFSFGYKASGDIRLLKKLAKRYGFRLNIIRLLRIKKRIVSSTYIRSLITNGRLKEASGLLGRPVSILGTVKPGTKRGRILGYPTANIDPHHEAIPPSGVYAVYILLNNKRYKGILNIGFRPTFHPIRYPLNGSTGSPSLEPSRAKSRGAIRYSPEPVIEVHIFNFNKDIYGRDLEIIFVKRLRAEKRFYDKASLIRRIRQDEKAAIKLFRRA